MPTLLITRPEEDAAPLAVRLRAMGIDSVIAPLMRVVNLPGPDIDEQAYAGLIITSANGARALASRMRGRDIPVCAVGAASGAAAGAAGFTDIQCAGGNVETLAALIRDVCDPDAGPLLHAAGSVTAGDLAGDLAPDGFRIEVTRLYEAQAVDALPEAANAALQAGDLDGVVLYSPRTARIFDDLVEKAGVSAALARLDLFALSQNVDAASGSRWASRHIAATPDQEALLHTVATCYPS